MPGGARARLVVCTNRHIHIVHSSRQWPDTCKCAVIACGGHNSIPPVGISLQKASSTVCAMSVVKSWHKRQRRAISKCKRKESDWEPAFDMPFYPPVDCPFISRRVQCKQSSQKGHNGAQEGLLLQTSCVHWPLSHAHGSH